MRSILAVFILLSGLGLSVSAQSAGELNKFFAGKHVTLRIDMPHSGTTVDVYPEQSRPLDYDKYNERLKESKKSILRNEAAEITSLTVRGRHIEVLFVNRNKQTARFKIHFSRVEPWMLTPATLIDALNRYVEFSDADKNAAQLPVSSEYASGFVRNGVVHLGPRTIYLKEGLKTYQVVRLIGQPSHMSELREGGEVITIYEFDRREGTVLIAEFVDGVLVGSRTESRVTTLQSTSM